MIAVTASIPLAQRAWALGQEQYVQFSAAPGGFTIVNAKTKAVIYVDPKDWPGSSEQQTISSSRAPIYESIGA